MPSKLPSEPPSLVKGRRDGMSIADALVRSLWGKKVKQGRKTVIEWPCLDFASLAERASEQVGYEVSGSTIRSTIYGHPKLFERCSLASDSRHVGYRLTATARGESGE